MLDALRLAGGTEEAVGADVEVVEAIGEVVEGIGEVLDGLVACSLVCFTFWYSLCRSGPDWDVNVEA